MTSYRQCSIRAVHLGRATTDGRIPSPRSCYCTSPACHWLGFLKVASYPAFPKLGQSLVSPKSHVKKSDSPALPDTCRTELSGGRSCCCPFLISLRTRGCTQPGVISHKYILAIVSSSFRRRTVLFSCPLPRPPPQGACHYTYCVCVSFGFPQCSQNPVWT